MFEPETDGKPRKLLFELFEVGRGHSQLVPRWAPDNPRLFTPRECARIMGFPNTYQLGDATERRQCKALYPLYLGFQTLSLDLWPRNNMLTSTTYLLMVDGSLLFVHTWDLGVFNMLFSLPEKHAGK